jgi:hypothetical protein
MGNFDNRSKNKLTRFCQTLIWMAVILACASVFAARRIEKRDDATNIVIGTVKAVNAAKGKGFVHYDVEVAVEKIEKGYDVRPGDLIHVRCYMRDLDWLKSKTLTKEQRRRDAYTRDSSYKGVPRKGDHVKVYANDGGDHYNGIYPDWYDLI